MKKTKSVKGIKRQRKKRKDDDHDDDTLNKKDLKTDSHKSKNKKLENKHSIEFINDQHNSLSDSSHKKKEKLSMELALQMASVAEVEAGKAVEDACRKHVEEMKLLLNNHYNIKVYIYLYIQFMFCFVARV